MFSKKMLRKKIKKVGKKILIQKKIGGSNLSNNTKKIIEQKIKKYWKKNQMLRVL